MFKYSLLVIPLQVSNLYGRGGSAPSAAYAYQSIGLHFEVQICLLTDGGRAPSLQLGFRPGK